MQEGSNYAFKDWWIARGSTSAMRIGECCTASESRSKLNVVYRIFGTVLGDVIAYSYVYYTLIYLERKWDCLNENMFNTLRVDKQRLDDDEN